MRGHLVETRKRWNFVPVRCAPGLVTSFGTLQLSFHLATNVIDFDTADMPLPERKHPAHQPVYDVGDRSNILFVTACTKDRKRVLTGKEVHQVILDAWREADHWIVGRYVIMPDHLHLFCAPARLDHLSVKRWAAFWKSEASKHWPVPDDKPIWQTDIWDTQLRRGESYSSKWAYVRENPVRHKLVSNGEDWPWQGELNQFRWHD